MGSAFAVGRTAEIGASSGAQAGAQTHLDAALTADVAQIDAVASILEVVCRTTGMGFAAVARVTQHRWVACAVRDEIAFGLLPGGSSRSRPPSATKFAPGDSL